MGFNKAFIKVDGLTIIERSVKLLLPLFDNLNIIANDTQLYSGLGVEVIPDAIEGAGSLGGIYTALLRSPAERVFVSACDMPYLDAACVLATVARSDGAVAAVPYISGRFHPMHAVYSRACEHVMLEMINAGDLRINALLTKINTRMLTEADYAGCPISASVENINTAQDLKRTELKR